MDVKDQALFDEWYQRFSPPHEVLASLADIFPHALDDSGGPPKDDLVAWAVLKAASQQPGKPPFDLLFAQYLQLGELEAARRVMELMQETGATPGQQLLALREEWENRRLASQKEYQLNKSRCQEMEPQFSALNLLDRSTQRQLDVLKEEAERLYERHRLGPAGECLRKALQIFEPRLEAARAVLTEQVENLRTSIAAGHCQAPAAGEHFIRLVDEYLQNNDIRLAGEYLEKAILASKGQIEPETRDMALESYHDPGEMPNIDLQAIVAWLSGKAPQIVDAQTWDTFKRDWALPQLRETAAGLNGDSDEHSAGELGAVVEAIRMLLQIRESKVVSTQTRTKTPWRLFFRNFFASLGVPANFVAETVQPLKGANEELFGWTEVRRISCPGSFLDTDFLRQPLLVLASRDPMNPQHQFASLVSHIKANQMVDRVGVVMTPHRLTQQRMKSFVAQAPRVAVLDEAAILKILLAPTPEARMSRFVAQVAGQLAPEVTNPFRPQGPVHSTMFFGRQRELSELLAPAGPAIVYGGRRLGKSSVLQATARRFEDGGSDRVAVYLPVTNAGMGSGTIQAMLNSLWDQIFQRVRAKDGVRIPPPVLNSMGGMSPVEFRARLSKVLDDNRRLQILILLDEADALVEALTFPERFGSASERDKQEASTGGELKDLVQKYQGRVHMILAGFQHIYRAATHPRSPFFNFRGKEPLAIGVLSETDAYQLITRSLTLLGLQFQGRRPIDLIRLYTGRHPSLLQAFCEQLLYRVRRANRRVIDSADVDAVFQDRDFRRQMFEVIHMNVEDDPRNSRERRLMRMVLYAWLHSEGSPTDLGQRQVVYPDEIYNRLTAMLGADACKSVMRLADTDEYLHDLHVLGVVQRTTDNGYFLVNPNLPVLLRQFRDTDLRDEIDRIWLQLQEPTTSHQRSRVQRSKDPDGWTLAPITQVDEGRIDESIKRRVVCLMGSSHMGKSLVVDWLRRRMASSHPSPDPVRIYAKGNAVEKVVRKLARAVEATEDPVAIGRRLVHLAERARPDQPQLVVIEDVDQAAMAEAWRRWRGDGLLAALTNALRDLEQRDMAGKLWIVVSGGLELARAWRRWPEYMEAHAAPIFLRRFNVQDRSERQAWIEANLEDRALSESARDVLWGDTQADPRLLEGFLVWSRSLAENETTVTEARVREYLSLLKPGSRKHWPAPVRNAVADVPSRVRALVAFARAWEEHFRSADIPRSMLGLLWSDEGERGRLLERLSGPMQTDLQNLTLDEVVQYLQALVDLDELARTKIRHAREEAEPGIAVARAGDIWSELIAEGQG